MGSYAVEPNAGQHVNDVLGLEIVFDAAGKASCKWYSKLTAGLTEPRSSGCATPWGDEVVFAGGHNNSASYVARVDSFVRSSGGVVANKQSLDLPVGRELLGCVSAGNVTIFAGGKPPHPPAPYGETNEVDIWHHNTGVWNRANLSVERKKVEAVHLYDEVLMAGGEIGHHPPAAAPGGKLGGYSSNVDILTLSTGKLRTEALGEARQYFAVATAGGKAFFGGGFRNLARVKSKNIGRPLEGARSNLVDIYESSTGAWTRAHLSTNRSNLMGVGVMDRYVLFAGGTRIPALAPDVCGTMERSAVVDIYDTTTNKWSTACMATGRTSMNAVTIGRTAVFFGGIGGGVDLFVAPPA